MSKDTNTKCYYCNYCYSCDSCDSCDSCYSCYYCYSCYSCDSCDSCYYSYGLRMSERMLFCLGEGKFESKGVGYQKNNMIFNQQVTSDEFDTAKRTMPSFELPITKWVDKKDMTKEEKSLKSYWETTGGYLKTLSYKDAWKEAKMSDEFKTWVKGLPHLSVEIFESITGLKLENDSLKGQVVEVKVGGKTYTAVIQ